MTKSKVYDIFILVFMYVGISCIPFGNLTLTANYVFICRIVAQVFCLVLINYVLSKSSLKRNNEKASSKNKWLLLPTFLICFSNFFCLIDPNCSFNFGFDASMIWEMILALLIAMNEELIFRMCLLGNMSKEKHPLFRIFIASLIFGLCHITHYLTSLNPVDLIDCVYTFGLGFACGIFYIYSGSITYTIALHFFFNVGNDCLFRHWVNCPSGYSTSKWFLITNIIVAISVAIYLIVIYIAEFSKQKDR